MSFLACDDLKQKKENFILHIENFKIAQNKINIILGENGAGKTTLLNYIIENKNIFNNYKKILLTQNSFVFNRSCIKNVEMVLKWNDINENAMDYLEVVGLSNKADINAKQLSGGEKKRLAFAVALATNADIIFLDEPFASIDYKNQIKLVEIIKKLQNKTIVIVSHKMSVCKKIGDYFIYLENGKLTNEGYKEEYLK